ncbi:SPFH domain-containing protein [Photobacterium leiognathi]|uniref:SPFH domain-containing protein n=1 Tax=Photobacterium leiognathi TaxID=553611 RepID=UPI0029817BFA|nr:SPFH domain-containing protein [Photobacterium leiognathi]
MSELMTLGGSLPVASIFIITLVVIVKACVFFVSSQEEYLIERLGKYSRTCKAGLNFKLPFIETIVAKVSMKEVARDVERQTATTKDNVMLEVDGILYYRVIDSYKAYYGVEHYEQALIQLGKTTFRSIIGSMELTETFSKRSDMNMNIISSLSSATDVWGIQLTRFEVAELLPSPSVKDAMEEEVRASRAKRADILRSEGKRDELINIAEGEKAKEILDAEAKKQNTILKAEGDARAVELNAQAAAQSLKTIGEMAVTEEGRQAIELQIAEKAIDAKTALAKESTVLLLPENSTDIVNVAVQAMAAFNKIKTVGTGNSVE